MHFDPKSGEEGAGASAGATGTICNPAGGNPMRRPSPWGSNRAIVWATSVAVTLVFAWGTLSAFAVVPLGDEFQVNSYDYDDQETPHVSMNASGEFVVVWMSRYGEAPYQLGKRTQARRFDVAGQPVGTEFRANLADPAVYPNVALADDGTFLVVWEDYNGPQVEGRRFDAQSVASGGDITVTTAGQYPKAAAEENGSFAVVWSDTTTDHIKVRRITNAGALNGGDLLVNPTYPGNGDRDGGDPFIVARPGGGFVVAWNGYHEAYGTKGALNFFDATGSSITGDVSAVTPSAISVIAQGLAARPDGGALLTWADISGMRGQRMSATGTPIGGPLQLLAASAPEFNVSSGKSVAALADGGFVVAWSDFYPVEGIFALKVNGDGTPAGDVMQVNTGAMCGGTDKVDIAATEAGSFVVTWTNATGCQDRDVFARVFTDADAAASCEPSTSCAIPPTSITGSAHGTPGTVAVSLDAGDLANPATITVRQTNNTGFALAPNGTSFDKTVLAVELGPPGQTFASPVTVTFSWAANAGSAAFVDDAQGSDTQIRERNLAIWHDGCRLTASCDQSGGACLSTLAATPECAGQVPATNCSCNLAANTFTLGLTSFSELLLAEELSAVGVMPTKLIVVDNLTTAGKAKTVYVTKDTGVTKGTGTDSSALSVSFRAAYSSASLSVVGTQTLPSGAHDGTSGWVVNSETVAKYVNKAAPAGPTQAKVAVVKPGTLLKLVSKGLGDVPLHILAAGAPTGDVTTSYCVDNDGAITCHCSRFDNCAFKSIAADTGAKLVCKGGLPDASCGALSAIATPTTSSTSTTSTSVTTTSTSTTSTTSTLPSCLQGTWTGTMAFATGLTVEVDADGSVTGTAFGTGPCGDVPVSGTVETDGHLIGEGDCFGTVSLDGTLDCSTGTGEGTVEHSEAGSGTWSLTHS